MPKPQPRWHFQRTWSIDSVITVLVLVGALLTAYVSLNDRLARLEVQMQFLLTKSVARGE